MDMSKINLLGIIAIIGAILMIVGVFLSWAEMTISSSYLGSETSTISGWEVFSNSDYDFDYSYAPIVALICGVISLVLAIIPTFIPGTIGRILGIVAFVLAIVTVVVTYLFYSNLGSFDEGGSILRMTWGAGIGVWLTIAGGVITIIGGLLDGIKKSEA